MKKFIIPLYFWFLFFCLNSTSFSQSGWLKQSVNTTRSLFETYFINDNTGWIVGDSAVILNTTNGGTNWIKNTYPQGGTLVSTYYKNQNSGFIGGYYSNLSDGFIIKTTNGGNNWSRTDFTGEVYDIFSFGSDTLWASRHDGYIVRSTNFGNTWTSTFLYERLELYTIYFINNMTGWTGGAVYQEYAYIYKTTDGGLSWFNQFISAANHFYSIYFVNATTGFAATLGGIVYATTNGGTDWFTMQTGSSSTLNDIQFPVVNTGYVTGESKRILKTTNNGVNWNLQILPPEISTNVIFYALNFRNANLGWVVGSLGTILKTTNGGEIIGIQNIGNSIPTVYKLSQNYPNPFNPTTTIEFDLPQSTYIKLIIFDITGKEIKYLVDQELSIGSYKVTFDGNQLSSGIYYYKLLTSDFSETKKFVLVK